jgi:UDP-glucose 4-epimerase
MHADPITQLSGTRLLVTGASGFIGTRLCRRATAEGAVVHGVSRRERDDTADVRWETGDLADPRAAADLIERAKPDAVIHLASEVTGARDADLVVPMLHANLLAAVNVMLGAARAGCSRVVLAGSMEEPDAADPDPVPQSPYAAAKWAAQGYARHLHALHGVPVTHLRVFMVYGPEQHDLRKLVPYVTTSLLRGDPPQLTSGARAVDWVYVDDVVDAFLRAAVTPGLDGRSFDIGSGELVTTRDLALRLHEIIGGAAEPEFGAIEDRPLERVRAADPRPAGEAMGWRPATALSEGLERTVSFYRSWLEASS